MTATPLLHHATGHDPTFGLQAARDQLFATLAAMGFVLTDHSINRIDYAVDFLAPGFEPRLDGFVAHARTKVRPHWSAANVDDPNQPSAVLTGRRLESITVGKMPGRQTILYDKYREVISQRKPFWFEVWGISAAEASEGVWRVEVRAGKKELTRWNVRRFADVETVGGDVVRNSLDEIRYIAPGQGDSNVTRQRLDPLWEAMIEQVERGLFDFRSGVLPSQIKEVERGVMLETYRAQVLGNLAGLAVAQGLSDTEIALAFPKQIERRVIAAIRDPKGKFFKAVARARERLHFIVIP